MASMVNDTFAGANEGQHALKLSFGAFRIWVLLFRVPVIRWRFTKAMDHTKSNSGIA
jgi:hypothetical protein